MPPPKKKRCLRNKNEKDKKNKAEKKTSGRSMHEDMAIEAEERMREEVIHNYASTSTETDSQRESNVEKLIKVTVEENMELVTSKGNQSFIAEERMREEVIHDYASFSTETESEKETNMERLIEVTVEENMELVTSKRNQSFSTNNKSEVEQMLWEEALHTYTSTSTEPDCIREKNLESLVQSLRMKYHVENSMKFLQPPKRQSLVQKNKQRKMFIASQRNNETEQERQARLSAKAVYAATSRARETEEETQARLSAHAIYAATSKAQETEEETQARLSAKAVYAAISRARETEEETQARLSAQAIYAATSRARETEEETQARLSAKAVYAATSRARETEEEYEARLTSDTLRRTASRNKPWKNKKNAAFSYDKNINYQADPVLQIGRMNDVCQFCMALRWKGEAPGICCSSGKVRLPQLNEPPDPLHTYLIGDSADARHFQKNTRSYNSSFAMTSFGAAKEIRERGYMPTFKVQGQVYHVIGSLLPLPNKEPKFLQVYFVSDNDQQAQQRCRNVCNTKEAMVKDLQEMLLRENNLVRSFKTAMEKITPDKKIVLHADRTPVGEHERRYNVPNTSEVAVVLSGDQAGNRDIVLEMKDSTLRRIADTHRSYDALQYPLIFWQGEDGYNFEVKQVSLATGEHTSKKVSAMDFYAYRIMFRASDFNIILRYRDLFHQFAMDMFAKIESERLRFIRFNQKKLRVEEYVHLRDAINSDVSISELGRLIILPSSFTGGPRYMHERTQDAMTYVRNYGRPDLFLTFTCNPNWPEVTIELLEGQKPQFRHDLLARVFRQKLKKLMELINKGSIFGVVRCFMYTVEWQKRGLPHAHILLWLTEKIRADKVDDFISAELPNPETDPQLHNIIRTQMVHGPCGNINPRSPCMKDGTCTKRYPRPFLKETQTGTDGYPLYKRRSPEDGGFTTVLKVSGFDMEVDNRWVVPFCPLLSRIFSAHLNVEFCSSVKSIKYICKYVNKGSDMTVFSVEGEDNASHDEVHQYEVGRYISSNEAIWRILGFPIHERHPTVVHLSVHLENGQRVYFTSENAIERALAATGTTLTEFFLLCQTDDFARTLLYHQLPKYYTWNASGKKWCRRKAGKPVPEFPGIKESDALGRVFTVHPNMSECFHLRLLLHEVTGPTSFQDLKTFEGHVCETFKQACHLRGLLEDDAQWQQTLEEAAATRSPSMLRNLFAVMLQTCAMSNPLQLWIIQRENMTEDILHRARVQSGNFELTFHDDMFNSALIIIEDKIRSMGGCDLKAFGLPEARREERQVNYQLMRETGYNMLELDQYVATHEPNLVQDQREAFERITSSVFNGHGGIFFIDAPFGTGKTFLINLLLAKVRQRKMIALAVASSGIAATLLQGGRTAHSAFKLPLNIGRTESPTCNISKRSDKAKVLQECKMIVWDECTMSHKAALEAVDVTLQDLRNDRRIMGGVVMVLCGDFRQTLPVIPRGTKADEIQACIKESYLWKRVQRLTLKTNMRVHLIGDVSSEEFAKSLLQLGNGQIRSLNTDGMISMESIGRQVATHQELKDKVFPNVVERFRDPQWLCERAILAARNDSVEVTNNELLAMLPGVLHEYRSVDTVIDINDAVNYPTEILNKMELPGMPQHRLQLKIGSPIMLLRNLDPPAQCNGTRLVVKKLTRNVIEATILTGTAAGTDVLIPRIPVIPMDLPFEFKRLQFPVRLSFAMTINKAQGQSLKIVGLDLRNPCFSHGQLYVGCSRVGDSRNLFILSPEGKTKNIVYPEVL